MLFKTEHVIIMFINFLKYQKLNFMKNSIFAVIAILTITIRKKKMIKLHYDYQIMIIIEEVYEFKPLLF